MGKKERPRTARRRDERALSKLGDARERLAELSEGGTPEHPIVVPSASVVEQRALGLGCARCDGSVRLVGHEAERHLRRVRTRCVVCGHVREVWIELASRLVS